MPPRRILSRGGGGVIRARHRARPAPEIVTTHGHGPGARIAAPASAAVSRAWRG